MKSRMKKIFLLSLFSISLFLPDAEALQKVKTGKLLYTTGESTLTPKPSACLKMKRVSK